MPHCREASSYRHAEQSWPWLSTPRTQKRPPVSYFTSLVAWSRIVWMGPQKTTVSNALSFFFFGTGTKTCRSFRRGTSQVDHQ